MKTIFTPAEFIAITQMSSEFARELKKAIGINADKLDELRTHLRELSTYPDLTSTEAQNVMCEIRSIMAGSQTKEEFYFDSVGNLVIAMDPEITIKVAKILSDNAVSVVNMGITIYGMARMLFGTVKSIGKQIEAAFKHKD